MKKILLALALVAVASTSADAAGFQFTSFPLMRWIKGATTDSTTIALVPSYAVAAVEDTTEWFDMGQIVFPETINGSSTAASIMSIQLNAQQAATLDSMYVTVQRAVDPDKLSTNFTTTAAALAVGTGPVVTISDQDDAPFRFFRVIVEHRDGSITATRLCSVRPIAKVAR